MLKTSQPTVYRDLQYVLQNIYSKREEFGKQLFEEHAKTIVGFNEVLRKLWSIVDDSGADNRERLQALALIMQCYDKKLDVCAGNSTEKLEQKTEDLALSQAVF